MVSQRNDRPYHSIDDIRLFIGLLLRCPYLAPFLKYSGTLVKNRQFCLYPTFIWYPCCGLPHWNFIKISWVRKLATHATTHDNMFSHFERKPACDRRTDAGYVMAHTALAYRRAVKIVTVTYANAVTSVLSRVTQRRVRRRGLMTNSFHFRLSFNRTLLLPNIVTPSTLLRIVNVHLCLPLFLFFFHGSVFIRSARPNHCSLCTRILIYSYLSFFECFHLLSLQLRIYNSCHFNSFSHFCR